MGEPDCYLPAEPLEAGEAARRHARKLPNGWAHVREEERVAVAQAASADVAAGQARAWPRLFGVLSVFALRRYDKGRHAEYAAAQKRKANAAKSYGARKGQAIRMQTLLKAELIRRRREDRAAGCCSFCGQWMPHSEEADSNREVQPDSNRADKSEVGQEIRED